MAKTREIQRDRMEKLARASTHMRDCPIDRGGECSCPANLPGFEGVVPKEVAQIGGQVFWRIDDGYTRTVKRAHPNFPREIIQVEEFVRPLWTCRSCGWSIREVGVLSHTCDPTFLAFRDRPVPLSRLLSAEQRFGGGVLVTVRRDAQGCYFVGEMLRDGDLVVTERQVLADYDFRAVEGCLAGLVSETFQP